MLWTEKHTLVQAHSKGSLVVTFLRDVFTAPAKTCPAFKVMKLMCPFINVLLMGLSLSTWGYVNWRNSISSFLWTIKSYKSNSWSIFPKSQSRLPGLVETDLEGKSYVETKFPFEVGSVRIGCQVLRPEVQYGTITVNQSWKKPSRVLRPEVTNRQPVGHFWPADRFWFRRESFAYAMFNFFHTTSLYRRFHIKTHDFYAPG